MQQSFENPLATLPLGGNVLRNTSPKLFILPKKTGHEQLQGACTRPATLHRGSYTRSMDLDPASRIRKLLFRSARSRAWLKM